MAFTLERANGRWTWPTSSASPFHSRAFRLASSQEVARQEEDIARVNGLEGARSVAWLELVGRDGARRRHEVGWARVDAGGDEVMTPHVTGPIAPQVNKIWLISQFLITPDVIAIELHVQDQLVVRFDRPASPPRVDAILLAGPDVRVAIRIAGATLPIEARLEPRDGDTPLGERIRTVPYPGTGAASCWSVLELDDVRSQPGLVYELTLQDGFHFWELRHGSAAKNDSAR